MRECLVNRCRAPFTNIPPNQTDETDERILPVPANNASINTESMSADSTVCCQADDTEAVRTRRRCLRGTGLIGRIEHSIG